jgi:hypothetical protein
MLTSHLPPSTLYPATYLATPKFTPKTMPFTVPKYRDNYFDLLKVNSLKRALAPSVYN